MIYRDDFEEVVTFESFYKNVLKGNGNIIFPYINVGVSLHELNRSDEIQHIDRSYIIFIDAIIEKINKIKYEISEQEKSGRKILYIGGVDIETDIDTEITIYCKDVYLQTLDDSQLRKEFWLPIETPYFPMNMNPGVVESFFSHEFLPENLKKLVGKG